MAQVDGGWRPITGQEMKWKLTDSNISNMSIRPPDKSRKVHWSKISWFQPMSFAWAAAPHVSPSEAKDWNQPVLWRHRSCNMHVLETPKNPSLNRFHSLIKQGLVTGALAKATTCQLRAPVTHQALISVRALGKLLQALHFKAYTVIKKVSQDEWCLSPSKQIQKHWGNPLLEISSMLAHLA